MKILLFSIEERRYALDLKNIERILWAVEYTPIPNSPEHVLGAINNHGEIIPIINLRQILRIPHKEINPSDNLILCQVHQQRVALLVDRVDKVQNCNEVIHEPKAIQCILKEEEEITLLCDLEKLIPESLVSIG